MKKFSSALHRLTVLIKSFPFEITNPEVSIPTKSFPGPNNLENKYSLCSFIIFQEKTGVCLKRPLSN